MGTAHTVRPYQQQTNSRYPGTNCPDHDEDLYRKRLMEQLLEDDSYESLTPVYAIFSAFHRIAKDRDDPEVTESENILEKFDVQNRRTRAQEQLDAARSQH
jgi:hypothetical protein